MADPDPTVRIRTEGEEVIDPAEAAAAAESLRAKQRAAAEAKREAAAQAAADVELQSLRNLAGELRTEVDVEGPIKIMDAMLSHAAGARLARLGEVERVVVEMQRHLQRLRNDRERLIGMLEAERDGSR